MIVSHEYKQKRVADPTEDVNRDKARSIKMKVKEYLDKALYKERKVATRQADQKTPGETNGAVQTDGQDSTPADGPDLDAVMSDVETGSTSSQERKRKRDDGGEDAELSMREVSETPSVKRLKDDEGEAAPPPPPPPPPESAAKAAESEALVTQQADLLEQEQALMRENEEAERLEAVARHSTDKGEHNLSEERLESMVEAINGGVIVSGDGQPTDQVDRHMSG